MRKQNDRSIADEPDSVEDIIAELVDNNEPVTSSGLAELTDLNAEEAKLFFRTWDRIETKRRRMIVNRLIELMEDRVELNFDAIFKHCLKDTDEVVRRGAIEGLWENEEASFIQPLIDMMEQDSSVGVRKEAAIALGRFAELAEHGRLSAEYKDRLSWALLAAVDDKSNPAEVRRRALEAVAPLSLQRVRQAIMEAYRSGDTRQKTSAVYAMGKNCDIAWLRILLEELASDSAELRYEAAIACGELGEEEAVPRLIGLTEDYDKEVQLVAVQALGRIGGSEAREHVELCLSHSSGAVRQIAEQALYELETMTEPASAPWIGYRGRG
ncbi:MAG TPA: HEAT repeat domain-containing protein [Dehalococcoidia bacterium]|nr:HEAT repeat domain-containing protein [Dehalococcoidia bacterium]